MDVTRSLDSRVAIVTGAGQGVGEGIARKLAMLGAHDHDVASVPIGDDLILQVFRVVAVARKRIERRAELRALAAQQPVAGLIQRIE